MPTAPSRSSQPPHFQIHSAVYVFRPKIIPPLHFTGFQAKQKIHMFNFSKGLISKTAAATPLVN